MALEKVKPYVLKFCIKQVTNTRAINALVDLMGESTKKAKSSGSKDIPHAPDERVAKFALSYLDAFGYMKNELNSWSDITVGDIVNALGQFQTFFGLSKTRKLDIATVRAMEAPRCGCPDIVQSHNKDEIRLREFINQNLARWTKTGITYTIKSYLPTIPKASMDAVVQQAFNAWTQYANVNVSPASAGATPDIVISYGQGAQSNFDGPGGTLAWAYLPNGSDQPLEMRFDVDETWVLDGTQRGIILLNVATHEFGHLLGLDHSKVQSALMAPYYNAAIATPQPNDDIPRIQARYGVRQTPVVPVTPVTPAVDTLVVTGTNVAVTLNGRTLK